MHRSLKILSEKANTVPSGAVYFGSALFSYAILLATLVYEILGHLPQYLFHIYRIRPNYHTVRLAFSKILELVVKSEPTCSKGIVQKKKKKKKKMVLMRCFFFFFFLFFLIFFIKTYAVVLI